MSNARILYLEDDEDLGSLTAKLLAKEGFEVVWKTTGIDGMDSYQKEHFNICILDIMMPKLDGYSLLNIIRSKNTDIPVIILSARVLTDDVLKGFQLGADDYIRKPFSVEELVARIHRLLQKAIVPAAAKKFIEFGSFKYNPDTYELKNPDGSNSFLSPRAGELLYRLLTNKENILPKKETLIELWGDDSFFNGRSLDVFITRIRKQLAADESLRIVNIRARGYKLIIGLGQ